MQHETGSTPAPDIQIPIYLSGALALELRAQALKGVNRWKNALHRETGSALQPVIADVKISSLPSLDGEESQPQQVLRLPTFPCQKYTIPTVTEKGELIQVTHYEIAEADKKRIINALKEQGHTTPLNYFGAEFTNVRPLDSNIMLVINAGYVESK